MESDSSGPLLPILIFIISQVLLFFASFAKTSISSLRRERLQWLVSLNGPGARTLGRLQVLPLGPTGSLSLLMYLAFAAGLLSSVALVISRPGASWGLITIASVISVAIQGLVYAIARSTCSLDRERFALQFAMPTRALAWLLNPILWVGEMLDRKIFPSPNEYTNGVTEDLPAIEINIPFETDGEPLDEREVRMIRGVVELDDTVAREIMIPRVDMVVSQIDTPIAELADLMMNSGHSRIPIYRNNQDRIEGIAYARDILQHLIQTNHSRDVVVEDIIRPALFIPEAKSLEELLNEFQQSRVHMAIVVDEYGGVSGLVTIEDLLEEIVGEIMDEFDVGEPEVVSLDQNTYMMDAGISIDDTRELLGIYVEGDGFDTLGGFVYQRLGKIPSPGDIVDYDGLKIEVVTTVGRRLKRLRVTKKVLKDAEVSEK